MTHQGFSVSKFLLLTHWICCFPSCSLCTWGVSQLLRPDNKLSKGLVASNSHLLCLGVVCVQNLDMALQGSTIAEVTQEGASVYAHTCLAVASVKTQTTGGWHSWGSMGTCIYVWFLHVVFPACWLQNSWTSYVSALAPKVHVPREPGTSCVALSSLALEAIKSLSPLCSWEASR